MESEKNTEQEILESLREMSNVRKGKKVKCYRCGRGYYKPISINKEAPIEKCYTFVCPDCGDLLMYTPNITVE